ncbi:MAG: sirohydrochlorin chelatase [Rhodospirillales bacterium]|jgi:sirohydrochlorin cobaltochelatase|nr:sirohydrochlorin chelatase [Rhodospirillales bacterium]
MSKIGVMICGHGSRSKEAVNEFANLQVQLAERFPEYEVEYGFLEFALPVLSTGLDKLCERGVDHVLSVPGMLFAAGHVKNDIVSVLNDYQAAHADPNFKIEFAGPLDIDHKMLMAARARIEEAEAAAGTKVPREETLLMVVGRGTSDPDANGNVSKIGRMIAEGMSFAWGEVCYSGVTYPLVAPGLEHAAKLGYRRIIVFPYFLFTGVLVERIYSITDEVAAKTPEIEFIKAKYLSDQISVIDTFEERVRGILSGENNMNCQLCKYREQIIGFEAHHGLPQEGHHHHVEGIGTDEDSQDKPDQSHDGHSHHHPSHPHPEHPHGPGRRNPSAVD